MDNNHVDPREIALDIEKTRKHMSETLGEIHDRLSPNQLLDRTFEYVSDKVLENNNFSASLTETAKNNPIATTLIGLGLGWLIISKKNTETHENTIGKQKKNRSSKTTEDKIKNNTDSAPDNADRKNDLLEDSTKEKISQQNSDQATQVLHKLYGQPLVLIGAGLALGAAIGICLTSTQRDNKLLKKNLDKQIDQAMESGEEQLVKVKEAVISAVETINLAVGEVSHPSESSEDMNKKTEPGQAGNKEKK